jgi:hypothetical protein
MSRCQELGQALHRRLLAPLAEASSAAVSMATTVLRLALDLGGRVSRRTPTSGPVEALPLVPSVGDRRECNSAALAEPAPQPRLRGHLAVVRVPVRN